RAGGEVFHRGADLGEALLIRVLDDGGDQPALYRHGDRDIGVFMPRDAPVADPAALASGTRFSATAAALIRMSLTEIFTPSGALSLACLRKASSASSSQSTLSGKCGMSRKLSVRRLAATLVMLSALISS